MWPVTLSGRLPVIGLVGRYPTNYLIGRGPLPKRHGAFRPPHPLLRGPLTPRSTWGISRRFQRLSPSSGQVTHVLLTRPPLGAIASPEGETLGHLARLACVRHAASVHPEPGSNPPSNWNLTWDPKLSPVLPTTLQLLRCPPLTRIINITQSPRFVKSKTPMLSHRQRRELFFFPTNSTLDPSPPLDCWIFPPLWADEIGLSRTHLYYTKIGKLCQGPEWPNFDPLVNLSPSHLPPPLQCPRQGYLVGVLQVPANGQASRQTGDLYAQRSDLTVQVHGRGLAL